MTNQTLLAEFMEKFGKRLNQQESRLGDELFMWLKDALVQHDREIIGEDEPTEKSMHFTLIGQKKAQARNKLRAKQRQRASILTNGEGE
jgi:hypothetical protein